MPNLQWPVQLAQLLSAGSCYVFWVRALWHPADPKLAELGAPLVSWYSLWITVRHYSVRKCDLVAIARAKVVADVSLRGLSRANCSGQAWRAAESNQTGIGAHYGAVVGGQVSRASALRLSTNLSRFRGLPCSPAANHCGSVWPWRARPRHFGWCTPQTCPSTRQCTLEGGKNNHGIAANLVRGKTGLDIHPLPLSLVATLGKSGRAGYRG